MSHIQEPVEAGTVQVFVTSRDLPIMCSNSFLAAKDSPSRANFAFGGVWSSAPRHTHGVGSQVKTSQGQPWQLLFGSTCFLLSRSCNDVVLLTERVYLEQLALVGLFLISSVCWKLWQDYQQGGLRFRYPSMFGTQFPKLEAFHAFPEFRVEVLAPIHIQNINLPWANFLKLSAAQLRVAQAGLFGCAMRMAASPRRQRSPTLAHSGPQVGRAPLTGFAVMGIACIDVVAL